MKELCDFPGCLREAEYLVDQGGILACIPHIQLLNTPIKQLDAKQFDDMRAAKLNCRARQMVDGRKK